MNTQIHNQWTARGLSLALVVLAFSLARDTSRAAVAVGSTAPDFTVVNHSNSQPLQLYSYQGNVILLDFWAYWCSYCQAAAADIEPNIVQYYRTSGGNANGVPVQVISVSVDLSNLTGENNFIATYGVELVGDDTTGSVYGTYGNGAIPYLVVINATTNSTNYGAWRVLYANAGYSQAAIRNAIYSVQTAAPTIGITSPINGELVTPPDVRVTATVVNRGKIIKRVEFYDQGAFVGSVTNSPYNFTWHNATLGTRSVTARAIYGTSSWVESNPVEFTVGSPAPIQETISRQGTNILLTWSGGPGLFRVQMATNFVSPAWQYVTSASTNTTCILSDKNQAAFYRIIRP